MGKSEIVTKTQFLCILSYSLLIVTGPTLKCPWVARTKSLFEALGFNLKGLVRNIFNDDLTVDLECSVK